MCASPKKENSKHMMVLGVGNMGAAIVKGILLQGALPGWKIWLVDPSDTIPQQLLEDSRTEHLADISKSTVQYDLVLLAIKPQAAAEVLPSVASHLTPRCFAISIMAGRSCETIRSHFGMQLPIIRAMPNLPVQLGLGMTTLYQATDISTEHITIAKEIFSSCGETLVVQNEDLIDASTALAGSGPGYLFHLLQAAFDKAQSLGFSEQEAKLLVTQSVRGAIALYEQSNFSLTELEAQVTSPKGTTEAGIHVLQDENAKDSLAQCIQAAYQRAKELRQ